MKVKSKKEKKNIRSLLDNWIFLQFFSDGKFHVVPSGDLHILRADLPSDGAVDYRCKVRNKLTSTEHTSPPFNLIIDGKWRYQCDVTFLY